MWLDRDDSLATLKCPKFDFNWFFKICDIIPGKKMKPLFDCKEPVLQINQTMHHKARSKHNPGLLWVKSGLSPALKRHLPWV